MRSFRRLALLLAFVLPALHVVLAQSSSSNPPTQAPAQDQAQPQQPAAETPQQQTVQARIHARREQRRAAAIHDAYSHLYETWADMGYLRFKPGPSLQRLTFYSWDTGLTRYFNERFGVVVDGRGYYGTAYVGLNKFGLTRPSISQYDALGGITYRFYLQPRYSVATRIMAGYSHGNFSGDTNGIGPVNLGLYPDSNTFAASASVTGEMSLTPNIAFRLAPEYFATGYGSSMQNSLGFTGGLVYRFGKR
ncbi:MAG TPA: hypothetical protein VH308_09870 [Terracidiphilus sp.]|nr:hypothetical protein [Terracidiphilus sp.]